MCTREDTKRDIKKTRELLQTLLKNSDNDVGSPNLLSTRSQGRI